MTVKELIEELKKFDQDLEVICDDEIASYFGDYITSVILEEGKVSIISRN